MRRKRSSIAHSRSCSALNWSSCRAPSGFSRRHRSMLWAGVSRGGFSLNVSFRDGQHWSPLVGARDGCWAWTVAMVAKRSPHSTVAFTVVVNGSLPAGWDYSKHRLLRVREPKKPGASVSGQWALVRAKLSTPRGSLGQLESGGAFSPSLRHRAHAARTDLGALPPARLGLRGEV